LLETIACTASGKASIEHAPPLLLPPNADEPPVAVTLPEPALVFVLPPEPVTTAPFSPALPLALLAVFALCPALPNAPPVPPSSSELSVAAPQPNNGTNNAHEKYSLFTVEPF
jgi:hypothetical protein